MHTSTLSTAILSAASIAHVVPTPRDQDYGISVSVVVSPGTEPVKIIETWRVELNRLVNCDGSGKGKGCSVSELAIEAGTATGYLDDKSIECRAYKDNAGIQPGSAPFNVTHPAYISTNLATISSLLCYVATIYE